jgi:hypothetical protein
MSVGANVARHQQLTAGVQLLVPFGHSGQLLARANRGDLPMFKKYGLVIKQWLIRLPGHEAGIRDQHERGLRRPTFCGLSLEKAE